jgi:hypothetical protein
MTTHTTTNLKLAAKRLDTPPIIVAIVLGIFVLSGLVSFVQHLPARAVATPTPGVIILIATAQPQSTPAAIRTAEQHGTTTVRALVAYDAPDGQALGAIEAGRAYQVLASYGAAWLQADVAGSGVVWLRAADLLGAPGGLVDLRPTDAPRIVVVSAPAPAYTPPTPDFQQMSEPPAPPPLSDRQAQLMRDHFLAGREVQR